MKKIIALLLAAAINLSAKDFTVVIDAGHGGKDCGATRDGIYEKKNVNIFKY